MSHTRGRARALVAPLAVVLSVLVLAAGCGTATAEDPGAEQSQSTSAPSAQTSLDFTGTTIDGADFTGSSLSGKPTVLWFWAPWCPTCQGQVDGVNALAESFAGEVEVVGVGGLDDPAALEGFADDVSGDVTVLSDSDGAIWRHFGVTAQSTYVVLDADGSPVESGYLADDELVDVVDSLADPVDADGGSAAGAAAG